MPRCVHLASDLHLGAPNPALSRERERAFVRWMRDAAEGCGFAKDKPATELHLVGDIFDFWHEYHHVVPKGGARVAPTAPLRSDSRAHPPFAEAGRCPSGDH